MSGMPTTEKSDEPQRRMKLDWKEVRSVVEHENTLINHRLTWLIAVEAGLLVFVATIQTKATGISSAKQSVEVTIIALCGMIFALWMHFQLKNAHEAIEDACKLWHDHADDKHLHPRIQEPDGASGDYVGALKQAHNLPFAFVIIWMMFIVFYFAWS